MKSAVVLDWRNSDERRRDVPITLIVSMTAAAARYLLHDVVLEAPGQDDAALAELREALWEAAE